MENRRWLEELRAELTKRRLPAAYVGRLVEELSDHWDDLTEETMSTQVEREMCLGVPAVLATAAREAYRGRLLQRRPLLAGAIFVLLPLPLLLSLWLGLLYGGALVLEAMSDATASSLARSLSPNTFRGCITALVILSTGGLAGAFAWLARRTGVGRWGLVSALLLPLVAGLVVHQVTLSDVPGQSSITLGIGLGVFGSWQAVQLVLALTLSLLFLRLQARAGRPVPLS